ncbi:MAG TPA: sugar nucleotide-binding protein, partial [Agitococcus sp.]|nr:sugar nucleotide-binding protein [Agitococcus sp.]
MARILLTGVSGQVGHELLNMLAPLAEVIAVTRQDMDLSN